MILNLDTFLNINKKNKNRIELILSFVRKQQLKYEQLQQKGIKA